MAVVVGAAALGRVDSVMVVMTDVVVVVVAVVVVAAVVVLVILLAVTSDVEGLGPLNPWPRDPSLGFEGVLLILVCGFGLFEDVDKLLALRNQTERRISLVVHHTEALRYRYPEITITGRGWRGSAASPLTVLITLPELLMMVTVSVKGILT